MILQAEWLHHPGTQALCAALEAQGYQIEEIEFEGGKIEVELTKDGVETELVLSDTDGVVTAIELEEDDEGVVWVSLPE